MGFIPLPLGVVMLRVVVTSIKSRNPGTLLVVTLAYFCLITFRVLGSIVILGKAADLIDEQRNKEQKKKDSTASDDGNNESTLLAAAANNGGGGKMTAGGAASGVEEVPEANSLILQQEPNSRTFLFQNSCVDRTDMLLLDNTLARETVESGTQADTAAARKASVSTQVSPTKRPTDHHYTSPQMTGRNMNTMDRCKKYQ